MAHWMIEHGLRTILGVMLTAVLGGIGWLVLTSLKVPELELQLKKHDEQLSTIRVSLIALMQKTGNPPDKSELEKLVSGVFDLGKAKAALVQQAQLEKGTGVVVPASWVPPEFQTKFPATIAQGVPVKDKEQIARIISAATVADKRAIWTVSDNKLKVRYGTDSVISLTPARKVTEEELKTWATSLNAIGTELSQVPKKDAPPPANQ